MRERERATRTCIVGTARTQSHLVSRGSQHCSMYCEWYESLSTYGNNLLVATTEWSWSREVMVMPRGNEKNVAPRITAGLKFIHRLINNDC